MNGETGFLHSFVVWSVPVCGGLWWSVEDPRGSSLLGASSCRRLVFGKIV